MSDKYNIFREISSYAGLTGVIIKLPSGSERQIAYSDSIKDDKVFRDLEQMSKKFDQECQEIIEVANSLILAKMAEFSEDVKNIT